jgi:hypothetical protein
MNSRQSHLIENANGTGITLGPPSQSMLENERLYLEYIASSSIMEVGLGLAQEPEST